MTEHAVNNGSSICQTAEGTHLILTFREFCANKTLGFSYSGQRAELEFHLVSDPVPLEIRLSLYVRNISKRQWHVLTYADPFNNNTDTEVKELAPNEDVFLYPIREFSFGNREELIIYFRFDRDAVMLQAPEVEQEQLEYMWSRLQSLLQDSQFADMRVNGLPAHRAVLAAASGPLHETIAALIRNNQSSELSTSHDVCKTTEHSNVDSENVSTNTMEEGQQNDVKPEDCNNDDTVDVKTYNDEPPECNSEQREQIANLEKIPEHGKESFEGRNLQNGFREEMVEMTQLKFEERNLQNSADSQNKEEMFGNDSAECNSNKGDQTVGLEKIAEDSQESLEERKLQNSADSKKKEEIVEKESNSGVKRHSIMVSNTSDDVITESSKRTENSAFITAVSQLMKFFESHPEKHCLLEQATSMFNNFPTEHVEVEEMECPHPDNYQLEIFQLRSKTNTERFLEYIYTSWYLFTKEKRYLIDVGEDLITMARLYDLKNLERDAELEIVLKYEIEDTEKILDFARLYDLYTLKTTVISFIRWNFMDYLQDPLGKYVLMPNHRYQNQCLFTFKVPNISKLMEAVTSKAFYVCGCALQVQVTKQSIDNNDDDDDDDNVYFDMNLVQTNRDTDVILLFDIRILLSDKNNETLTSFEDRFSLDLHQTRLLRSFDLEEIPAGCMVDDTVDFVFLVESYNSSDIADDLVRPVLT